MVECVPPYNQHLGITSSNLCEVCFVAVNEMNIIKTVC